MALLTVALIGCTSVQDSRSPALVTEPIAAPQEPISADVAVAVERPCTDVKVEVVGHLDDQRLPEASGLATSPKTDEFLAINDRGNGAFLISLTIDGDVKAETPVRGIENVDWEDLAFVELEGAAHVVIADIGDNDEDRPSIALHLVPLPRQNVLNATDLRSTRSLDITYPDGPHNAEALLVTPTGEVAIVTRGANAILYVGPNVLATKPQTLTRVGSIWDGAEVRAGAVSPDGDLVALRTEDQIRIWALGQRPLAELSASASCVIDLAQNKPEALTFTSPLALLATGEGKADIYTIELARPSTE